MAIIGIKCLRFGVDDVELCTRFFLDFGLSRIAQADVPVAFALADGSRVELFPVDHPELPRGVLAGQGVRQVVWGVDTVEALAELAGGLAADHELVVREGVHYFLPAFGVPMGVTVWQRKPVVNAPDPLNAPGVVNRLNTHRKWRRSAQPKVINHVVFQTPDYEAATDFMCNRLGFRISDVQQGFGRYLRANGSNNHHNILLLNANAHLPGCDGQTRFDHMNFGVEDIDELMIGANGMARAGWPASEIGLGRHRVDSALFYYLPFPGGGEIEYGADADYVDDNWAPRNFTNALFGYAQFTHNIPDFLKVPPAWGVEYLPPQNAGDNMKEEGRV